MDYIPLKIKSFYSTFIFNINTFIGEKLTLLNTNSVLYYNSKSTNFMPNILFNLYNGKKKI